VAADLLDYYALLADPATRAKDRAERERLEAKRTKRRRLR